jgi:hypothetical protein
MIIILILGVSLGAIAGLRRSRVFALAPVILLIAAGAIASDGATGQDPRVVMLDLLAAVAFPQIGYVIAGYLSTRAIIRGPVLFRAMQTAIGDELTTLYALPQEMPLRMIGLLKQLNEQQAA